jgi:hypothetical protein
LTPITLYGAEGSGSIAVEAALTLLGIADAASDRSMFIVQRERPVRARKRIGTLWPIAVAHFINFVDRVFSDPVVVCFSA